ncbi:MAG: HD domain-containing protein [Pyrinomonadaceae bacterium]|nr:HD domain-containing protein [Pyrinomonadaceae bacterium]
MPQEKSKKISFIYQTAVTVVGICLWLVAAASLSLSYSLRDQLTIFALVPVIIVVGMFQNIFPALGLKFTERKITLSLSDSIVLLTACLYGPAPAIFIASIEGFTTSWRAVRRPSTNLFSSSMMSLTAAAAAVSLGAVLFYGFGEEMMGHKHSFLAVAVAMLIASIVQITINMALLSPVLALRHGTSIMRSWKDSISWAAPMFLPVSTAASLMYLALQFNVLVMLVVGVPIFLAVYYAQRRHRDGVQERISMMKKSHQETIEALAVTINAKDEVTHEHVLRVQIYATGVAHLLKCDEAEIEALKAGALLHDIGKIAVPDHILHKPGKLTAAEFEKMKSHTLVGAQILGRVEFPYPVVPIVRNHHERWDGKGYPDGLAGEDIPLTARILSVVDCFDAVREDRQYRKGMTREEAIKLIMDGSGVHYDPRVVGTFITHLPEFEAQIQALRDVPVPTFGLEPIEAMSDAARGVAPAAGLAETAEVSAASQTESAQKEFSHKELSSLYELAQTVNAACGRDKIAQAFTDKISQLVPYDLCAITLVVPESGENLVAHAAGQDAALLEGRTVGVGEGVTGWVLTNRKPFCNVDPKLDVPPELAEKFAGYRTLAIFPILNEREMHGSLALYSSSLDEYTANHQRLLKEAARLVATAMSTQAAIAQPRTKHGLIDDFLQDDLLSLNSPDQTLELELTH